VLLRRRHPPTVPREGVLVSATGEVLGVPDMLRADFGVGMTAATVDEALNLANAAMTLQPGREQLAVTVTVEWSFR
jgi:uncharacterized protein YggE